ncbi:transcript variant X2 [Nothobranchius furzeri]|uniref:Cytoplasmic aconitate hydratase n=3 Tax=Nothobranchius TaxID=28779 RepID=A0A9D2XS50_NOTFU|nr:transcript variant X1 [Nothobranchius furzeri]KAF7207322.1 transcript variant X2 [Nothobranchius furzeri]
MSATGKNPFQHIVEPLDPKNSNQQFFNLLNLGDPRYERLPFSIRVLLESAVRNCDEFLVKQSDVESILNWKQTQTQTVEVPFRPARVILQDFTGVPAVVDFAAMRDAVKKLGGDPEKINPVCPADLVIDHSIQVDFNRKSDSLQKNQDLEFERNKERFQFLKWGSKAFKNMRIIPPGSGIVHQVNLEYLARVVFNYNGFFYPDSLVGTDSHTTMIDGLGVLGWGVGGIEAEAVMLGQPISMVLPEVVGYKLHGTPDKLITSTDIVLTVTKHLRQVGVVGKFVEFFGPGVSQLSIADRATIANMCPEYGATAAFFPVDNISIQYLEQTGREREKLDYITKYLKAVAMFRDYNDAAQDPDYTQVVELDLSSVVPCCSGPKRPQDRIPVSDMKKDFETCLGAKQGFKGFQVAPERHAAVVPFHFGGKEYILSHGSVVIAAITSCTNTSNPSVMLGAGLLAKKAIECGLSVKPYIKTSLSPGSGVVTYYLKESGVMDYLSQLGFEVVGYGCMTCIGNSGPLPDPVVEAITQGDLVAAGVLSGNRNFEGRVHPNTRANYLASPPLVIAYAIAGTVRIDFEKEPIATSAQGLMSVNHLPPPSLPRSQLRLFCGSDEMHYMAKMVVERTALWALVQLFRNLQCRHRGFFLYVNSQRSEFPPAINCMRLRFHTSPSVYALYDTHVHTLIIMICSDVIQSSGFIFSRSSLGLSDSLTPREFNSYGSRRGNDAIMARGTFANIRLFNKFLNKQAPQTVYLPTGETLDVFDAAERYQQSGIPLLVLAGKEYGSGSSRDWAAKGPFLLGIKAVLAESYERIHRSNLVGMGVIPLEYLPGDTADSLGLTGRERYTLVIPEPLTPRMVVDVKLDTGRTFKVRMRFDTDVELTYFHHGGILNYMIRKMSQN